MNNIIDTPGGPQKIYDEIKRRHYRFLEISTERQLRVRGEWYALEKTKGMPCWQFEAEWERVHSELEEVGLGVGAREKMLAYICEVGPVSETIRLDRRPRRNADGTYTTRLPETWEECHEVLCELEGARAGTKVFTAARAGGVRQKPPKTKPIDWEVPAGGSKGKGKSKGKNGKPF